MTATTARRGRVFVAIDAERQRQDALHDNTGVPDGTSGFYTAAADMWRAECQAAFAERRGTWLHIFLEEVFEAMAETETEKLKAELIQALAVGVAWLEEIERRENG